MKRFSLLLFLLPVLAISQNVTTIATATGINDEMAFDLEGNLLGSHFQGSAITKLNLIDATTSIFSDGYNTPNGLAVDGTGHVFLADNFDNRIYKIFPDGGAEVFVEIESPGGLLFLPGTDTLVATSFLGNKVSKITADGTIIEWASGDMLNGPVGICADDDGHIYTGNFYGRRIIKILPDGSQDLLVQGPTSGWLGSIEYTGGHIYGTLINTHKIFCTDLSGNIEMIIGSTLGSTDGGPDQATFNAPGGIIASPHGDTLYVSETTTHNIRRITDLGGTLSTNSEILKTNSFKFSPNPFTDNAKIELELAAPSTVSVTLCNMKGEPVHIILKQQKLTKGIHHFQIESEEFPSGQYYITTESDDGSALTKKIIRIN